VAPHQPKAALGLLAAFLRFEAQGRRRPRQQSGDADRFAGLLAPAIVAFIDTLQRFADFLQELPLAIPNAQLEGMLLFGAGTIVPVGTRFSSPAGGPRSP
jgi:hypothetical protein